LNAQQRQFQILLAIAVRVPPERKLLPAPFARNISKLAENEKFEKTHRCDIWKNLRIA
jgi:hypothetical protein